MIWLSARRLDWALRTRGPALNTWPGDERAAALSLLRRSRAARNLLAAALEAEAPPPPDPAVQCRMLGVVRRALAPAPPVLRGMRWGAMAACAAAGLYIGLAPLDPDNTPDIVPTLQATASPTVLAVLDR